MNSKFLVVLLLALSFASVSEAGTDLVIVNGMGGAINTKGVTIESMKSHFFTSLDHKVRLPDGQTVEIKYPKQRCEKKPGSTAAWLLQGFAPGFPTNNYCIQYKVDVACILVAIYPQDGKAKIDFEKVSSSACATAWMATNEAKLIGDILQKGFEAAIAAAGLLK